VLRYQTILLSLIVFVFLPLSAIAADDADKADSADDNTIPENAVQSTSENDNIMLRQLQPIDGYEPLTVAGQQINAAFLEETLGEARGAIILFHDEGEALESWGVVTPLRHEMLQYGWSTLTLSFNYSFTPNILLAVNSDAAIPTTDAAPSTEPKDDLASKEIEPPADTAPTTDADPLKSEANKKAESTILSPVSNTQRIEAAIAFLQAKGIQRIVFLGHGQGGLVAIKELTTATAAISALILVGTPALTNNDEFIALNLAILDVYGDQDLAGVSAAVMNRKVVMKRTGNIPYTSREIVGANHIFYGLEPSLISTVRGWLYSTFVKQETSE